MMSEVRLGDLEGILSVFELKLRAGTWEWREDGEQAQNMATSREMSDELDRRMVEIQTAVLGAGSLDD